MHHCRITTEEKDCYIIPDVHQNLSWAEGILRQAGDHTVVFLGDYFDARSSVTSSHKDVCHFLNSVYHDRPNTHFLLGNHDVQYYEAIRRKQLGSVPEYVSKKHLDYFAGNFEPLAVNVIEECLDPSFWTGVHLFLEVDQYLVSHAGVAHAYWQGETREDCLKSLKVRCNLALEAIGKKVDDLLMTGKSRGGIVDQAGLTWMDWERDRAHYADIPQIVGHRADLRKGARQRGSSWCLDGCQTCYAKLYSGRFLDIVE